MMRVRLVYALIAAAIALAALGSPGNAAVIPDPAAVSVAAGEQHSCALLEAGGVVCWGGNIAGQLGDGTQDASPQPVETGLGDAIALGAGYAHTCAVTETGAAKCWGYNLHGEIGNGGAPLYVTSPVTPAGLSSGVVDIGGGSGHTCALLESGGVRCWGFNAYGQLGDGTTVDRSTPVDVVGLTSGVTAIAVGRRHSCAVVAGGEVRCWGLNAAGQLGVGTQVGPELCDGFACSRTPVAVDGVSAVALAGGASHTCAVTVSGGAMCWGANTTGQLGDGTAETRTTPVSVTGLPSGVTAVATGGLHTCAIMFGGAMCWGSDQDGELGDGGSGQREVPVGVSGLESGVLAIALGYNHTCAVVDDGAVRCWGRNPDGQLGDGLTEGSSVPVEVIGLGGSTPNYGDANCDGSVTSIDAALLLQYSAGLSSGLPCLANGDVDGNGVINAIDAALALQMVAGLI